MLLHMAWEGKRVLTTPCVLHDIVCDVSCDRAPQVYHVSLCLDQRTNIVAIGEEEANNAQAGNYCALLFCLGNSHYIFSERRVQCTH